MLTDGENDGEDDVENNVVCADTVANEDMRETAVVGVSDMIVVSNEVERENVGVTSDGTSASEVMDNDRVTESEGVSVGKIVSEDKRVSSDESVGENTGKSIDDGGIEVNGVSDNVKDDEIIKFEGIIEDNEISNDWGIAVEGVSKGKGVVDTISVSPIVSVCLTRDVES